MKINTFFKNAKHVVLVILSFMTSTYAYSGNYHTEDHVSVVTLDKNYEGAGQVYIHYTSISSTEGLSSKIEYSCQDKYNYISGRIHWAYDNEDTHVHYILAVESQTKNDYLWDGWYEQNSQVPFSEDLSTQTPPIDARQNDGRVELTYIAKWLLPIVNEVKYKKNESTINQDDLTETINNQNNVSLNIIFDIDEAKSDTNFNYTSIGEDFVLVDKIASPANYPEQIDMHVQYVPNGIHTASTHTISREIHTPSTYTLTTTSKYHGGSDDYSSKTFTWKVKEDYTPWFDIASTECVFDPVPINTPGTGITSGSIAPSDWNYAANQAYPEEDDGSDQISNEDNFLKNGCIWKVKLENFNGSCFAINKTDTDEDEYYEVRKEELLTSSQNLISFTPPADATTDDVYTANLYIKCEYYDAVGNVIVSKEKNGEGWGNTLEETVLLKGQALLTPSVLFGSSETATLSFNNVLFGSTPLKYHNGEEVAEKVVYYTTNITDIEIISEGSEYFSITSNKEEQSIKIELREDITPGQHQAIIYVVGTYEEDGVEKTKTATLTITADVVLDDPILEGHTENNESAGKGEVILEWTSVPGATGYTLYYKEGENIQPGEGSAVNNINSTSYRITNLTYDHTYSFIVVAHYGDEESLNTVSNVVTLRPTDFPSTIIWANRVTSLYTGTEKEGNSHPYMTKRKVDVTAAFDATSQNALFDYVVIFGKTEGDNSNNVTYSNANTPCYVYEKSDDKTYTIRKMGQDNYVNMNRTTKHPGFTIDATADSDKQMSIYITGYCPYASTGTTWEENAVMHITGDGSISFDLYLDYAQIYAREKKDAEGEIPTADMQDVFPTFSTATGGYMQGSGAIFAFTSTNGTFRPKIHLLGNNTLQSCDGMTLEGTYRIKANNKTNDFIGTYTQESSPIQVLPNNFAASVAISINNTWKSLGSNIYTAGALNLSVNKDSNAPLIDLGNEYSSITFGGGFININNTENRHIASYRRCERNDSYIQTGEWLKPEISQSMIIFGATKAIGSGKNGTKSSHDIENELIALTTDHGITFNDGTFNATYPIKVPETTEVNGGSYNCTFAHSLKNRYGKDVQRIELSTSTITSEMATIEDGLIIFKDGIVGFKKWMDKIYPEANWQDSENPVVHYASVSSYYEGANKTYGYSSLMPDTDGKVYLMLPKDGTPTIKPWVVSGPAFEGKTAGIANQEEIAMIYNTHQQEVNTFGKTYNILYLEADKYMQEAVPAGNDYNCNGALVSPTYNNPPVVGNTEAYTISNKAYIMKPIVATDWMLFCPPFDVANIYIIESYPETQLVKDYANGAWKIPSENIAAARHAQAKRTMDLYLLWWYFTQQGGNPEDFFVGENDYASYVRFWMNYEAGRDKDGAEPKSGTDYTPVIDKLCHFMGEEATYPGGQQWYNAAHYYLYESNGSWANEGETYKTAWNIVKTYPNGNNAIMKAGKVYALNFPYNTMGGHNPETTWDYWTGKYILIESTTKADGHTIQGSGVDMLGIKTVAEGEKAWLCGNPSFAITNPLDNDETQEQVWVVQNNRGSSDVEAGTIEINTHEMVPLASDASSNLKPTQAFLLAKPNERSNMRARTINYQTGEVTYETIEGEDDNNDPGIGTGIPTIMGDVSLLVVPTEEGITIIPRTAQRVMLFAADGKMLFNEHLSAEEHINVPTGVYIVRGEYEQVKAIKK